MLDRDIELPKALRQATPKGDILAPLTRQALSHRVQSCQDLSHAVLSPGYPTEDHICTNHSYDFTGAC